MLNIHQFLHLGRVTDFLVKITDSISNHDFLAKVKQQNSVIKRNLIDSLARIIWIFSGSRSFALDYLAKSTSHSSQQIRSNPWQIHRFSELSWQKFILETVYCDFSAKVNVAETSIQQFESELFDFQAKINISSQICGFLVKVNEFSQLTTVRIGFLARINKEFDLQPNSC